MPSYLLRDVDPELWEKFIARAKTDGHALKWTIVRLITLYVTHGLLALEQAAMPAKRKR
jgi:hypothetical protein